MFSRYFQFRGIRVDTAVDGIEAMQSVHFKRPDVIVLDLALPRMTGWDVLRELKRSPATRRIPVIVLSGQSARESAEDLGADIYIEKPCLPERLLGEVLRLLREPRDRDRREH